MDLGSTSSGFKRSQAKILIDPNPFGLIIKLYVTTRVVVDGRCTMPAIAPAAEGEAGAEETEPVHSDPACRQPDGGVFGFFKDVGLRETIESSLMHSG